MIKLRKILDVMIAAPLIGYITGMLCTGSILVVMVTSGCIPRDPHPERDPSPQLPCVYECSYR